MLAGGHNTALARTDQLRPRFCACCRPSHHAREMVTVMGPLVSGGAVVMLSPTIIKYMLDRADNEGIDFRNAPSSTTAVRPLCSAPLPGSVQQDKEVFGIPMIDTMGLTETCAPIPSNPCHRARASRLASIAFGNEVVIADERGTELPDNQVGELLIKEPTCCPATTRTRTPWHLTPRVVLYR